jgi:hypothetical protein
MLLQHCANADRVISPNRRSIPRCRPTRRIIISSLGRFVTGLGRDSADRIRRGAASLLAGKERRPRHSDRIESCCRQEHNGNEGKGFGTEAITQLPSGETAEEGEGDQQAGGQPGCDGASDRRGMGSQRCAVRQRQERKKRRAHNSWCGTREQR